MILFPALIGILQSEEFYQSRSVLPEEFTTIRTEGPVVDGSGNLYFCNMAEDGITFAWKKELSSQRGTIGLLRPDGTHEVFMILPKGMRGNGMRFHPNGNLLIADQLGGHVLELNVTTKEIRIYFDFPEDAGSPNDLAIRRDGTLYVSFFGSGLWMVRPDKSGEKVANGFHNGIDLSPDETLLYSANRIYRLGDDGMPAPTKQKLELPKGAKGRYSFTDGIRTDIEGNVYMARFGGKIEGERQNAVVHMFKPSGEHIRDIELEGSKATNLAFGGADGKTVYVTAKSIQSFRAEDPGRSFFLHQGRQQQAD